MTFLQNQLNDDQLQPEINTIIKAVLRLNLMVKHYTDHRVRSMVQFDIIEKTKNEWLKGDKSRIIIMLDHNQKVIG